MNISDFTTEETTIQQQIADVRAYAGAKAARYSWSKVADLTDEELTVIIGKRKNSRGAINAVFDHFKASEENAQAEAEAEAKAQVEAEAEAEAKTKRAKRKQPAKARSPKKKAAKAEA